MEVRKLNHRKGAAQQEKWHRICKKLSYLPIITTIIATVGCLAGVATGVIKVKPNRTLLWKIAPIELRIEHWKDVEYDKCDDGLTIARNAYYDAVGRGDKKTALKIRKVIEEMEKYRRNGKRRIYCDFKKEQIKASE